MREPVTVGGHLRIRPFNTADSYPEQRLDNDLCQAVVAGDTVYLRGQVPQDLDTGESLHAGNPAAQAEQVMTNVETLLAEAGASVEHVVSCTVYLTDIRHREPVYRVLGRRLAGVYPVFTGISGDMYCGLPSTLPSWAWSPAWWCPRSLGPSGSSR